MKPMTIASGSETVRLIIEAAARETSIDSLYREVTKNGIEACQERLALHPEMFGHLFVDVDYDTWARESEGKMLLRVTDNGIGFTPENFERYINTLHQSGKKRGINDHFGIGLKIGLWHSPAGVLINTIGDKDTAGLSARLLRQGSVDHGQYGLELHSEDGDEYATTCIPDDMRDNSVMYDEKLTGAPRGTSVTYFGGTARLPEDKTFFDTAVARSLALRYWKLPEGISLRVRNPMYRQWNYVIGLENVLKRLCGQDQYDTLGALPHDGMCGTVELSDARVHWFVFPSSKRSDGQFTASSANIPCAQYGVIYQDENYNQRSGLIAQRMSSRFGIKGIEQRVALFVEPTTLNLTISMSRMQVSPIGSADLEEYENRWAEEFRRVMPENLKKLCNDTINEMLETGGDRRVRLLDELKKFKWLETMRYKPSKKGTMTADVPESKPFPDLPPGNGDGERIRKSSAYRDLKKNAKRVKPDGSDHSLPQFVWTNDREDLKDKGGSYDTNNGIVYLNSAWREHLDRVHQLEQKNPSVDCAQIEEESRFETERTVACGILKYRQKKLSDPLKSDMVGADGITIALEYASLNMFQSINKRLAKKALAS